MTSSEAIVGDVTLGGTVAVLVSGMALGIFGALGYVALRAWLPARAGYRTLIFVVIVLGLGLILVVDGNQADFVFLNTAVSLVCFSVVLVLYASTVPTLIDRLAPRRVRRSLWGHGVVVAVLVLALVLGALAINEAFEFANGSRLPN